MWNVMFRMFDVGMSCQATPILRTPPTLAAADFPANKNHWRVI